MRQLRFYDDLGSSVDRQTIAEDAIDGFVHVSLGRIGTHSDLEAHDGYVSVTPVEQVTSGGDMQFEATFIGGPSGSPPTSLAVFVGREQVGSLPTPSGMKADDVYAWAIRQAVATMSGHAGDE